MKYKFANSLIEHEDFILPESDKINSFLLKNNQNEILKAIEFLKTDEKFMYIHGFMGTGKRQFINYTCDFLNNDVIKLEYYCKQGTVSDDILLAFSNAIEQLPISKALNFNPKIATLNKKFHQQISSIKKPFLIILHSLDDVQEENLKLITSNLLEVASEPNIKLIISTRALKPNLIEGLDENKKIFLKALNKDIFKEFLDFHKVETTPTVIEDFYKYTRGYYYYVALSVKIIQAMNISLSEFLLKFNHSDISFDSFLGITYINLVPTSIRNFFWFLRTLRHGITLNALAVFELYDEFAINYLKDNLMIFQANETLYVQDYFLQKIDISIPEKTEIKLHKYIINIYEEQLKESIKTRLIMLSRQAFRSEIEYHKNCIEILENDSKPPQTENNYETQSQEQMPESDINSSTNETNTKDNYLLKAQSLFNDKKYTETIELLQEIVSQEEINLQNLIEARLLLAKTYSVIEDYSKASYYYELVETYYIQHNEFINLNYLYYELANIYFKMYKNERAVETVQKVIYSVDAPQHLLVDANILLANIYTETKKTQEAYSYYKKALESLPEGIKPTTLAELYFKFALANDDNNDFITAFDYYNKCINIKDEHPYKAMAYSNIASCYLENGNFDDSLFCFNKAYEIEKNNNNYDGIYYNAINIAKIYLTKNKNSALKYLIEAKKSAEFINEPFYILEASLELGDYYYNDPTKTKDSLKEYLRARTIALTMSGDVEISKIESRISDMKLRMKPEEFKEIEKNYEK